MELGLEVAQPERIRNNAEFEATLRAIAPEAIVVVAYGRMIPAWMLELPKNGNINLHASLLPKYRGAAPIQWAVAEGETVTGNTTMLLNEGLDTGGILLQSRVEIGAEQTAAELFPALAADGAQLMVRTLEGLTAGAMVPRAQDDAQATHAPLLTREDGRMDFSHEARVLFNRWRGFQPWPGAHTTWNGARLTVHRMAVAEDVSAEPGTLVVREGFVFVGCANGTALQLDEVQIEGRKRMSAAEFLRGQKTVERLGL
jgi:methionyl-tRNA formyltransferase